jgi:hypothetical protein
MHANTALARQVLRPFRNWTWNFCLSPSLCLPLSRFLSYSWLLSLFLALPRSFSLSLSFSISLGDVFCSVPPDYYLRRQRWHLDQSIDLAPGMLACYMLVLAILPNMAYHFDHPYTHTRTHTHTHHKPHKHMLVCMRTRPHAQTLARTECTPARMRAHMNMRTHRHLCRADTPPWLCVVML